ncbi:MAG: MutS-related protein, partial [Candidatus Acidiferrales bacterium]
MRERLDLREQLAVAGEELSPRLHPEILVSWAESPRVLGHSWVRGIASLLGISFVAALIFYFATASYGPLLAVVAAEAVVYAAFEKKAAAAIAGMSGNSEGLSLLAEILRELENEHFTSPRLQEIARKFRGRQAPASHAIRKLAQIVNWIDARDSLAAHLVEFPLLYTVQLGYAAEAWRQRWGTQTRQWIDAVAEIEALLSLAAYSYEHPGDPFPEFDLAEDSAGSFEGEELGHPLIPAAQCVRNSVRLGKENSLLLISGSNMSGKSTLLRTVGVNAVLAMAGAPIRGKSLRLTPLSLGTSLRTTDSLQEGRSSFYTEILRIRDVFDLSDAPRPLLFLFDELLEGTNSKDRRI